MPMYEFQCTGKKCKHVYEELTAMDTTVDCPKCGKPGERQVSTVAHPVFIHRQGKFSQRRRGRTKKL